MTLTITVAEVKKNIGKDMEPGTYKLKEVLCDPCGYPAEPSMRRLRGKP